VNDARKINTFQQTNDTTPNQSKTPNDTRTRVKQREEREMQITISQRNDTYLKSTISMSVHPFNTLMIPFVPFSLDPMIVSLLSLRRPSSGFTSSTKL